MRPTVTYKKFTALQEGIKNGFTFALVDDANVVMHTPAQCKDYFQDVFWCEHRGKPVDVYGFTWAPGQLDLAAPSYRFALRMASAPLDDRLDNILNFLHYFEDRLSFRHSEAEPTTDPKVVILTWSSEWAVSPPMISAFTTLIRLGLEYPGGDPIAYLDKISVPTMEWVQTSYRSFYNEHEAPCHPAMLADLQRYARIKPRLKALLNGKIAYYEWTKLQSGSAAHGCGIVGFSGFPTN